MNVSRMNNGSTRIANAARRLGYELRCRRTQAGLTQRELAKRVRYSREMVAAVERGRRYGSEEFAVRCDEVLATGGQLARLWPLVESEQVAADRRRGPRPVPPPPVLSPPALTIVPPPVLDSPVLPEPTIPAGPLRPPAAWVDWAERMRPTVEAEPELMAQLRDLINELMATTAGGTDSGTSLLYRPIA